MEHDLGFQMDQCYSCVGNWNGICHPIVSKGPAICDVCCVVFVENHGDHNVENWSNETTWDESALQLKGSRVEIVGLKGSG